MTLTIARANQIARDLMDTHDLPHWRINWDNAKTRFGQCRYGTETLSFSRVLTPLCDEADFRNTVLHEIAHALTRGHNHDRVWRAKFIALGGDGSRCSEGPENAPVAPFTGVHEGRNGCTQTFPRHRRPSGDRYCPKCYRKPRPAGLTNFGGSLGFSLGSEPDNSAALIKWVRTSTLQGA